MKQHKFCTIVMSLILAAVMFAGCGGAAASSTAEAPAPSAAGEAQEQDGAEEQTGAEEPIVLKVAIQASEGGFSDIALEANKRFQEKYPHVTVEPVVLSASGWGEQATKMMAMVAAGNAPDVVDMATEGMQQIHKNKLALPLDKFLESEPELRDELESMGINPFLLTGEELTLFIEREYLFFKEKTEEWGIRVER